MTRTMWLAVFCLAGVGAAIAAKVAAPPSALVVQPAPDRSKTATPFALNESAKSDRLELPSLHAEAEIVVPAANTRPAETPSIRPATTAETASPRWQNANARLIPVAPPRPHLKSKQAKQEADRPQPKPRAELWHCRQDAVGSLLRSLDLSPRCDL
jgi:hypothetical protein